MYMATKSLYITKIKKKICITIGLDPFSAIGFLHQVNTGHDLHMFLRRITCEGFWQEKCGDICEWKSIQQNGVTIMFLWRFRVPIWLKVFLFLYRNICRTWILFISTKKVAGLKWPVLNKHEEKNIYHQIKYVTYNIVLPFHIVTHYAKLLTGNLHIDNKPYWMLGTFCMLYKEKAVPTFYICF